MAEQETQATIEQQTLEQPATKIIGEQIANDFNAFATMLNTSVADLKEEFYLLQIRKIMSKVQKTILRYDLTSESLEKMFLTAGIYGLGGVCISPAYLPRCVKYIGKAKLFKPTLASVVDFPFGESFIKNKVDGIKESLKQGANSIMVALQAPLLLQENVKELKKQCKKIYGVNKKINKSIIFDANEITKENYTSLLKTIKKIKISAIVLSFGETGMAEIKEKLESLSEVKSEKKLFVLANANSVEDVVELYKLGADMVLTPFADQIGENLLKRFNLLK